MTVDARVPQLVEVVNSEVGGVVRSAQFEAWLAGEKLQAGDLVVLNNSFLFREGIRSTTKSNLYLAIEADGSGLSLPPKVVESERGINVSFKRVASRTTASYSSRTIDAAVASELKDLGRIVFALVGTIGERETVSVPLARVGELEQLTFDPSQADLVAFERVSLSIRKLDGIDELWRSVEGLAAAAEMELGPDAAESFDAAFTSLQEEAGRPVDIDSVAEQGPSILTEVLARVDEQVGAFKMSLDAYQANGEDGDALSELLRISYNFADGAKSLLTLVVGLSDLKPLLFWLTVLEQSQLAERFAELPFSLVGKAKPSIDRYRAVVAGARNRAFHDLFAFGRPFQVRLTGDAFRAPELRLFREHSRRREPALQYEDRELVDLLEDFTRAQERPVPAGFWEKNYEVMRAVAEVGRAMQRALVLSHAAIDDG